MAKKRIEAWLDKYDLTRIYFEEKGELPHRDYETENGDKIGVWLKGQRFKLTHNKERFSELQIELLEQLGVKGVNLSTRNDMSWEEWYELAKKYKDDFGNLNISTQYTVNGNKLGKWWDKQKYYYRRREISQERKEKLDEIGMSDIEYITREMLWQRSYELAYEYYAEHGNLDIKKDYVVEGIGLGAWVGVQRWRKAKGTLAIDRKEKLEIIGMIWRKRIECPGKKTYKQKKTQEERWNEKYIVAKKYFEEKGHLNTKKDELVDGVEIHRWVVFQRFLFNNIDLNRSRLSQVRVDKLNEIGMRWENDQEKEEMWNKKYNIAKKYFEESGHLKLKPNEKIDGVNIHAWIRTQKYTLNHPDKSGVAMTPVRIDKLARIGICKREAQ